MIMEVSQDFVLYNRDGELVAYEKDGDLIILGAFRGTFSWIIRSLTYACKGIKTCTFCGKEIQLDDELTVDHLTPQERGGPWIVNNLVPCCKTCNNEKGNKSEHQYRTYRSLHGKERAEYNKKVQEENEYAIRNIPYAGIPTDWISYVSINIPLNPLSRLKYGENNYRDGRQYRRVAKFYEEFGYLKKPVIVSANGYVLDGSMGIQFLKDIGIRTVPIIRLDNVKVIFETEKSPFEI